MIPGGPIPITTKILVASVFLLGPLLTSAVVMKAIWHDADRACPTEMGRGGTPMIVLLAGVGIALNPDFVSIARTGMDTSTYVALAEYADRRWQLCCVLSLGGWLLVLVRPEFVLIATATPLALSFADRGRRRTALAALLILCILTGFTLAVAWFYYGTPLPLSFYVKSLAITPYAKGAFAEYGFGNISELFRLIRNNAPLLIPVFAFARPAFSSRPMWWGLLAGTAAFLFYETFLNALPIGNGGMRFFLPILPVLVFASAKAALAAAVEMKRSALPVLAACVVLQAMVSLPGCGVDLINEERMAIANFGTLATSRSMLLSNWRERQRNKWIALDRIGELEPGCIIATTELGVIGALYPSRPLLDLSGLTNPLLRHGLDPRWLIEQAGPDIVFADPLISYWGIDLAKDPEFLARYDYFPRSALNGYDSFAVRKDSACGRHFVAVVTEELSAWTEKRLGAGANDGT